jgi:hypothetical protein
MTTKEQKQLKVLIVLLVALGLTAAFVYRNNAISSPSTTLGPGAGIPQAAAANSNARIRLDSMKHVPKESEVGRNNLFQYEAPRPAPSKSSPAIVFAPPPTSPVVGSGPIGPVVQTPPPPPPMTFRYEAVATKPGGGLIASLCLPAAAASSECRPENSSNYRVSEGEVLMGRYRIARLRESVVEIEDLQLNRRQSFNRIQP